MVLLRNLVASFAALNLALAAAAALAQPGQLGAKPAVPHADPRGAIAPQIRSPLPNIPPVRTPRIAAPSQVISVPRVAPRQYSWPSPSVIHRQLSRPERFSAPSGRVPSLKHAVTPNLIRRDLSPLAEPSGSALAHATFQGHFANRFAGHRRRPIVIGWIGPLFWPYAYDDLVDYTLYPYVDDTFWPYAYDNLYDEMFGQYGHGSRATDASKQEAKEDIGSGGTTSLDVCGGNIEALTHQPIRDIAQVVGPDEPQRALLNELQAVTSKALEVLKAACSRELPNSPTEQIEAMRTRLVVMLQAVRIMRPALETFYQSLNDEQRARFDAADHGDDQDWPQAQDDSMRSCSERASGFESARVEQVERAVQSDDAQRPLLGKLQSAMSAAVELLKSSCPSYRPLTRVARLEIVEQRLKALARAVEIVQPALESFYSSLSDGQKDRFNRLGLGDCVHVIRQGKSASVCLGGAKASSSTER